MKFFGQFILGSSAFLAAAFGGVLSGAGQNYVWVEAESAVRTTLNQSDTWLHGERPQALSGGKMFASRFLSSAAPKPAFVLWRIEAPATGVYGVHFRHGHTKALGKLRYRIVRAGYGWWPVGVDSAASAWREFSPQVSVVDRVSIGSGSAGDERAVEWSKQGEVPLEKGRYLLEVECVGPTAEQKTWGPDPDLWVVIDAICLAQGPFQPSGARKPAF